MNLFSIIVQLFDIFISSFVTLINIFRHLWREIILGVLILILALILLRALRALRSRRAFVKELRRAAKENGVAVRFNRWAYLSLFMNLSGYDFEFTLNGVKYRVKFFPFNPKGRGIHLLSARKAQVLSRLAHRRAINGGRVRGFSIELDYENAAADNVVNVLAFSPSPIAITESNQSGTVWELDTENGAEFDGVYLFSEEVLSSRLTRLMDGYIDKLRHIDEV